jgi:hypothetical protein
MTTATVSKDRKRHNNSNLVNGSGTAQKSNLINNLGTAQQQQPHKQFRYCTATATSSTVQVLQKNSSTFQVPYCTTTATPCLGSNFLKGTYFLKNFKMIFQEIRRL